uniref:glycerophosphodiester phosphodiesterase family protein n=1 Tax=Pedobacter sp. TaxID=1411316 RepID=UPI003D7FBFB1
MKKTLYLACGLALMSLFGCKSSKQVNVSTKAEFPQFSAEAHRGGRGLMPENTIMAMIDAIDRGVTTLEMDAQITLDKEVVIAHDPWLNPLFVKSPEGKELAKKDQEQYIIYKMKYDDLRNYDVGSKFYAAFPQQKKVKASIPRLADLIDSVQT